MSEAPEECIFCNFADKYPGLMIHSGRSWSIAHIHDYLPEGTVVVFPHSHGLIADVTTDTWVGGAPFLQMASCMLRDVAGAERTYVLSFSEENYHFHFVLFPKLPAAPGREYAAVGPALVAKLLTERRAHLPNQVSETVKEYRSYAARSLGTKDRGECPDTLNGGGREK